MQERSRSDAAAPHGPRAQRDGGRRATAGRGEDLAAAHLRRRGFQLLARNVRTREGEIDIVAFNGTTLVFAEVKTLRARAVPGGREDRDPLSGLGTRQRVRLRALAVAWLATGGAARPYAREIRFDAIGVLLGARGELVRLEHLEGAW